MPLSENIASILFFLQMIYKMMVRNQFLNRSETYRFQKIADKVLVKTYEDHTPHQTYEVLRKDTPIMLIARHGFTMSSIFAFLTVIPNLLTSNRPKAQTGKKPGNFISVLSRYAVKKNKGFAAIYNLANPPQNGSFQGILKELKVEHYDLVIYPEGAKSHQFHRKSIKHGQIAPFVGPKFVEIGLAANYTFVVLTYTGTECWNIPYGFSQKPYVSKKTWRTILQESWISQVFYAKLLTLRCRAKKLKFRATVYQSQIAYADLDKDPVKKNEQLKEEALRIRSFMQAETDLLNATNV